MIIFLIGFMGSGKSTIGRRLARKLSWEFMDMDHYIEEKEGLKVDEVFEKKGEEWFRKQEQNLLHSLNPSDNLVVATGGGAPCYSNNMDVMNEKGVTVYLKMHELSLVSRLENARVVRPLVKNLTADELLIFIRKKLEEREPFYSQAHCIIKGESVKSDHVITLVFGNNWP